MVLDLQHRVPVNLHVVRAFVRRLRTTLGLGPSEFNVCFVNDREIARLNGAYRGRSQPTDVLSFPWRENGRMRARLEGGKRRVDLQRPEREPATADSEFRAFLGDIAISPRIARANARQEGHTTEDEIRWLILHGCLHLLGYDHETDSGEMTALELLLREKLGVSSNQKSEIRNQKRRTGQADP
jgi:probable rRNA maturation factor